MSELGLTGPLADLLDPNLRDKVVAERKAAGMGSERYGVVCGIIDPETKERCMKRICPQGWQFAIIEGQGKYCPHGENYEYEVHEDITDILEQHGLPWRPLKTRVKMHEATDKNKKKRKKKQNEQAVPVIQHGTDSRDESESINAGRPRPPSLFRAFRPEAVEAYEEELRQWRAQHPDATV